MTTYLGKSCSFCLPRVPFGNCRQFMYLVISLLVLRAGYGIWLYQFLIIAYLFTFHLTESLWKTPVWKINAFFSVKSGKDNLAVRILFLKKNTLDNCYITIFVMHATIQESSNYYSRRLRSVFKRRFCTPVLTKPKLRTRKRKYAINLIIQ